MTTKTLAMKLLEKRNVPFEAATYPTSERDAEKLAVLFGVSPAIVYKSLVVVRGNKKKPILALVSADTQLNLKKLAKAVGEKKLQMAAHKEAERLTGLQVGGISPLALLNKGFEMVADDALATHEAVYISSGQRGINLKVPVIDLLKIINVKLLAIT